MIDDVMRELERDATPESAALVTALASEYFEATRRGEGPVSSGVAPNDVDARFDEPLPEDGRPLRDVVERVRSEIMADANRLAHPMYMGHQVSFPLSTAVWTDAVISSLNQSIAVEEMSPTLTALEGRVVRWMCDAVGYPRESGGTFTSGGTEATFTALLAARAAALPDSWLNGISEPRPVVLCGEHTHYAVTRAVAELGLGMRSAIAIPSVDYRMDVAALERELDRVKAAGTPVMAVVATAGHTATGSFDDVDTIGLMCDDRGLWMHIDGAHGATAVLSARHRHRVRGIERARSIAWDPHKMMLLPLPAGMLLVRDERDLQAAFAQRAPYLFHGDGGSARVRDQGVRSFQCSRRADVLKLWVVLQRHGRRGIAAVHDHMCDLAVLVRNELGKHREFVVLHEPQSNILCFRYVGDGSVDDDRLDAINREMRERYNRSGTGWITSTLLGGRRVLRVTMMNPRSTPAHIATLVETLLAIGRSVSE
ncbi:MAG TPA: pyridoxal-dependent decarboxylase [Gemmatimonadaceae bacterium]|nr:pyridoxal-dependent decarboxylase [Gemmatimonadaceae bacterium]